MRSPLQQLLLLLLPALGVGFQAPFLRAPVAAAAVEDSCAPNVLGLAETLNEGLVAGLKGAIDVAYTGRDIQRFYVLETLARVPYFSYLSCLHLYESLGMRGNARLMRIHYAEADNELHHLLIMESLGGAEAFVDRFVAQHLAFGYYWYTVLLYLISPRAAYHLSVLVEEHAYYTYDGYLADNAEALKQQPVPEVATRYYESGDSLRGLLDDESHGAASRHQPASAPRKMRSLYDVFERVREDEAGHRDTLAKLVAFDSLDVPDGCDVDVDVAAFS